MTQSSTCFLSFVASRIVVFNPISDRRFGLAAYACTRDVSRIFRLNDLLEAGMIGINEGGISAAVAPFGGVKQSGLGREGGPYGLEEFMEMKYICLGLDRPVVS